MVEPVSILLAEDDDGHAALIERNLVRAGFLNKVYRVCNGLEALEFLRGEGEFREKPKPRSLLVILDINMPRLDGFETLKEMKRDATLSSIPVIILTTTDDPREIEKCYREGCNVYIAKPVAYDSFIEAIRRLGLFLEVVQVPPARTSESSSGTES